ncbi:MAG TPA: ABC transporter substrate-binding protein [Amycolatopsis sp.]|nr:ABC transporter substrate-binding protein [Amycolatopsis sp.]
MRRQRRLPISLLAVATVAALTACGSGGGDTGSGGDGGSTVVIGDNDSFSGAYSAYGLAGQAGVKMAIDDINAAGGFTIGGKKYTLRLDAKDNRSDPTVAATQTTALIRDDQAKVIFGPTVGVTAGPTVPLTQAQKVLQLSPASILEKSLTPDLVTGSNKWLFHNLIDEPTISKYFVQGMKQYLPTAKKIAILYPNDSNSSFILPIATKALTDAGYEVSQTLYPSGTTDFTSYLTSVKNSHPDVLWLSYVLGDAQAQLKAANDLKAAPAFAGWNLAPSIADSAPASPLYLLFNTRQPYAATTPQAADFFTKLKAASGGTMPQLAGQALWYYDYVFMLVDAMKVANSTTDTTAIAAALQKTTRDGVLGKISWDPVHTARHSVDVALVQNGKVDAKALDDGQ